MGKPRARKLRLSDLQRAVMFELREAGEDYLTAIVNFLAKRGFIDGGDSSPAETGILGLAFMGLIELSRAEGRSRARRNVLTREQLKGMPFRSMLSWDDDDQSWTTPNNAERITLILTSRGRLEVQR